MPRILVTGMSGVGKSTLLAELARRGHFAVDTDYDGWELSGSVWDEPRMDALLAAHADVVVSGTVENQRRFYHRFEHVVLLSAPVDLSRTSLMLWRHSPRGDQTGSGRNDRAARSASDESRSRRESP